MKVLPALNIREHFSSDGGMFLSSNELFKFRGIKHDFSFINILKVPLEVLKTEVFNTSRGTVQLFMNDKIMLDRYYCINLTKHFKIRNFGALFYIISTHFPMRVPSKNYAWFGSGSNSHNLAHSLSDVC